MTIGSFLIATLLAAALAGSEGVSPVGEQAPIRERIGGGNIVTHLTGPPTANLYQALQVIGARMGRMDSYGWRDLKRVPTPHDFDAAMLEAYQNGIRPLILLEYEGSYQFLNPPQPVGSYEDWFEAGRVYAKRFGRGGDWARENNAGDWGAEIFTAINEPDVQATIPLDEYRHALAGFADGVHSVNSSFKVVPGGFATCNSHGDPTFRGYGPVIADLLNDGRLDGIDLHTYYHPRWYPIERGREFSAQTCFDKAKGAIGVTRDINFYATEFNTARVETWDDDQVQGSLFLTAIWDQLGVRKADGSSATVVAFPWNLFDTGRVEGPAYAMATGEDPWTPDVRSKVLKLVVTLAGDMTFVDMRDPSTGAMTLEDDKSRLVVVQNKPGWTERKPEDPFLLPVPGWAVGAELWGWSGLRRSYKVEGMSDISIELPVNETSMLLFRRR